METTNRNLWVIILTAGLGAVLLLALVFLALGQEPEQGVNTAPTPTPADPTVATVNDQPIGQSFWLEAVLMDQVMSGLAGVPAPTSEETLERLINEVLVLQATSVEPPSDEEVESTIATLESSWGVDDAEVTAALKEVQLEREALERTVARLLMVQRAQTALESEGTPIDDWLTQERAQAEIVIYRELTAVEGLPAREEGQVGLSVGNQAPDFALNTPDGELVTLSDYQGRPVLLTFCASWSEPCPDELGLLQFLWDRYQGTNLEVLAVDVRDEPEAARQLAQQAGYQRHLLLDDEGSVAGFYQVQGVPTSVILDPQGRIVWRTTGPLKIEEVEQVLDEQVQQATPTPPSEADLSVAPDFTLQQVGSETFTLSDQLSQGPVALVFFQRCG